MLPEKDLREYFGDGMPRHPLDEIGVVILGNHVLIPLRVVAIHGSMHLVNHCRLFQVHHASQVICLDRQRVLGPRGANKDPFLTVHVLRFGGVDHDCILLALCIKRTFDEIVVICSDDQQLFGEPGQILMQLCWPVVGGENLMQILLEMRTIHSETVPLRDLCQVEGTLSLRELTPLCQVFRQFPGIGQKPSGFLILPSVVGWAFASGCACAEKRNDSSFVQVFPKQIIKRLVLLAVHK